MSPSSMHDRDWLVAERHSVSRMGAPPPSEPFEMVQEQIAVEAWRLHLE
jgi:hypothetical protein